jgi:hypothetical protein
VPGLTLSSAQVTLDLDNQAFLRVMKGLHNNPAFNDHVQDQRKPSPTSKAAALLEQPLKNTKKPTPGASKSSETPAQAYLKLEKRSSKESSEKSPGQVRLVPTHEFSFPPPITRSGEKNGQGSHVSVHTDGVETAYSLESSDFKTRSSTDVRSDTAHNHGTILVGSQLPAARTTEASQTQTGLSGLGIHVLPPAGQAAPEHNDDLIVLDQEDQFTRSQNVSDNSWRGPSNRSSMQSADVPDIMDDDLDIGIPQNSLTPTSSRAPRAITFRGARYVRDDLGTAQGLRNFNEKGDQNVPEKSGPSHELETRLQATRPRTQNGALDSDSANRVVVAGGLNIGAETIQDSILGDHNIGIPSVGSAATSASLRQSMWASDNIQAAPFNSSNRQSISSTRTDPQASHTVGYGQSFRHAQSQGSPMTDISASLSSRPKDGSPFSNVAAPGYAAPKANVNMSHTPPIHAESASKDTSPKKNAATRTQPPPGHTALNEQSVDPQAKRGVITERPVMFKFGTTPRGNAETTITQNPLSPQPGQIQPDEGYAAGQSPANVTSKTSAKPNSLGGSKWGISDAKVETSTEPTMTMKEDTAARATIQDKLGNVDVTSQRGENNQSVLQGRRHPNPFDPSTKPAVLTRADQSSATSEDASHKPAMAIRSGNVQTFDPQTMSFDQRMILAMNSGPQAGPETHKSLPSKWTNSENAGKAAHSQSGKGKQKPSSNLMSSKYATDISRPFSAYARRGRAKRANSDSEESEL